MQLGPHRRPGLRTRLDEAALDDEGEAVELEIRVSGRGNNGQAERSKHLPEFGTPVGKSSDPLPDLEQALIAWRREYGSGLYCGGEGAGAFG